MKDGQVTRQFDGVKVKKDLAQTMKEMTQVEAWISKKDPADTRKTRKRLLDRIQVRLYPRVQEEI